MTKLSKEELLSRLSLWVSELKTSVGWDNIEEQAYQQIKELIQKPEVTEEWIEEKARAMYQTSIIFPHNTPETIVYKCKEFIRSLVEEVPAEKATVMEEFVEKWRDYLLQRFPVNTTGNAHNDWLSELKQMLKEAGVHIS